MARMPLGITAYRFATAALSPVAPVLLQRRRQRGKEDRERAAERLGFSKLSRPDGALIWVHGASNGECVAALPLIETFVSHGFRVLVTSGTVTSAMLMRERLPQGAFHQFVPVDAPAATARFLKHWRPDIGLFVDSDLWPNLILGAKGAGTRLALVNARMSQRSFESWRWARKTAATILGAFDVCLAQDDQIAARFRLLGSTDVRVVGSLKEDAPPLPYDAAMLAELRNAVSGRPILLAAQTHPGEDETILPAHDALRARYPHLLTIIVPRHTSRGVEIAELCATRTSRQRSKGGRIEPDTAVYIADTIGELGLFYRLASFAFVGGTLVPMGGHNPLEAARLRCAVLAGPHTFNSASAYKAVLEAQGFGRVSSSSDIASLASRLFDEPEFAKSMGDAAARGALSLGGAVEKTYAAIRTLLGDHASA